MASTTSNDDNRSLGGYATFKCDQPPSAVDNPNCEARIFARSADEEICITGMAGSFPSSRNVAEFEHNLWNKVKMTLGGSF